MDTVPPTAQTDQWHDRPGIAALHMLHATAEGLTTHEAAARISLFGTKTIPGAVAAPWWKTLLRQFVSPLIAILIIATIITATQRHWVDAAAIAIALTINAAIGFWQERKAERDVLALQSLSVTTARVRRDGAVLALPADQLVPGDIVLLDSGDQVPADLRLLETNNLQVDESMLTGESLAVTKSTAPVDAAATLSDRLCMAFSGTFVTSGRAVGLVVATGRHSEIGKINELISVPSAPTPLEVLAGRLEKLIVVAILLAVVFTFIAGLIGGYPVDEMFRTAVALSVGAIPESLPVILTVAMALGVSRMARRHAIVRTLPSVETLGSTTVIASDKTGTLTQNRLTVEVLWTPMGTWRLGETPAGAQVLALRAGALTNEAKRDERGDLHGDAVDVAMAQAALDTGAVGEAERAAPPVAYTPYEPELRYSQAVRLGDDGRHQLYVKGQPDVVAGLCTGHAGRDGTVPMDLAAAMAANDELAASGLRVLATAYRPLDGGVDDPLPAPTDLVFLGLEGMTDPPREGVADAIGDCRRAGIAVKMLTGDQPSTAEAIAHRLGLDTGGAALTGAEIATLDDDQLGARLAGTSVAARVSPHDKLRIVQVLGDRGEVVAVTGDGVNDAPAFKAAAIGVAMGESGTDVAREAADVVLTDDDFVTIVHAVEQGRVTFAAIRKATFFLLSTAVATVLALLVNILLDQPLLFLPIQILWVNLVTNGIQDLALAMEPAEGDELTRRPRPRSEGILSRTLWVRMAVSGAWIGGVVLLAFWWGLENGDSVEHARTFALTTFVLLNFIQVGNARTENRSLLTLSPLRNKLLAFTSVGAIALYWGAMHWPVSANLLGITPLAAGEWALAGLLALTVLVVVEVDKLSRRILDRPFATPLH